VRRVLVLASAIVFVDTTFYSAITPLLPHFEDEFGLSKSAAGVLAGAYAAGTLVGALPGGYLAAKAGVRATVLLGLALMTVSSVAFAFADSIGVLDAARFVQGIGGAASWAGALAWVAGAAPRERRGELIGTTIGAAIAGALAGPAIGALADAVGIAPTFSGIAVVGVLLAAWALRTPPAQPEGTSPPRELLASLRDSRVTGGMGLIAVPGLLFGTVAVLVPLRLDDLGVAGATIGAVFLLSAAVEAVVSPLAGRFSDRAGRLTPIRAGLVGAAVMAVLLPLPETAVLVAVTMSITFVALAAFWAPGMALLSDAAEEHGLDQALAFAISNLAWALGHVFGAGVGGAVADATADAVPYTALAVLCGVTFLGLTASRRRSEALST
jgi:predicted MFS family arabinose efflux permease